MGRTQSSLRSYSSSLRGPLAAVQEGVSLIRVYAHDVPEQAVRTIEHLRTMEREVFDHTGMRLEGLKMLDVGAGQRLAHMRYFRARGNEVTGVDRDLIVQGWSPLAYLHMARSNGVWRAVKTAARKALLFDARFNAELERHLGDAVDPVRKLAVRQADASQLPFPSGVFDFAYSSSVMQYVVDPSAVLREMARVVRDGGVVYVDFMLYTGPSGSLDVRQLGGRGTMRRWAHLRRGAEHVAHENATLNRLRLSEWRPIFDDAMPGAVLVLDQPMRDELESEARALHQDADLLEYEVDELVTTGVSVVWRKH